MLTWEPAQSSCEFPPGCTMSEHGFLKPNPVLFDLERLKPRAQLGHELGQGAPCGQCGHKCSGFELHFWKKVCQNCRCGKIEHGVLDREDPGQFFVGKIFDRYAYCIIVWLLYNLIIIAFRPLRTREEEHSFIYGDILEEACDISDYDQKASKWTPSGLNKEAVSKLLQNRVDDMLKVSGPKNDAVRRIKQLEKQFPLHDVEPEKCHQLSPGEIDRWQISFKH